MALPGNRDDREFDKFAEVSGEPTIRVDVVRTVGGSASGATEFTDDSSFTAGTDKGNAIGGIYTSDTIDVGDYGVLKINADRELSVFVENAGSIGGGSQYADATTVAGGQLGTVAMGTDGSNLQFLSTDSSGVLGVNILSGSSAGTEYTDGTASAGGQKGTVVMALDSSNSTLDFLRLDSSNNLNVNVANSTLAVTQSGTWNVGLSTGSNTIGKVKITDGTNDLSITAGGAMPISDDGGSITVDGTVGITEINTDDLDTGAGTDTQAIIGIAIPGSGGHSLWDESIKLKDGSGTSISSTGSALDVNIASGVTLEVNLDEANDSVQVYGYDGTVNRAIKTDTSGNVQVDVLNTSIPVTQSGTWNVTNVSGTVSLPTGAATETTLASADTKLGTIDTDTGNIATSTSSIDTKLSTTNTKLTDIETNTDALATVTKTTVGADIGLDVNVVSGSTSATQYQDGTAVAGGQEGNVMLGTDGANLQFVATDSSGNLQVDVLSGGGGQSNSVDSNNSTTSSLGSGATFTGTATDVSAYNTVSIMLSTDQDSATNGMSFQFSTDGTNWDDSSDFAYDVSVNGTSRRFQFPVTGKYFRVKFTNGAVAQGHLRIQTILHNTNILTSIHPIDGSLSLDRSATLVKSVIAGETTAGGGSFVNVKVDPSGSIQTVANQDTHDSLLCNANIQVGDVDVSSGNPVPISDAGGSITVDGTVAATQSGTWNVNNVSGTVSLPTGAATETTLSAVDTKLGTIDADTGSILTKITDVETNTDSLAGLTNTTVAADVGLDVNIIGGVTLAVDLSEANDSVLVYGNDGTNNQKIKTDSSGNVQTDIVGSLPAGTNAIGKLAANSGVDIGDVTVTNSAFGATQSGTWNITNVSGTVSLPTGAATAANQLADGHNVTVDNASGASAVNIQDGGNSITVDNAGLTDLAAAINSNKVDVNVTNSSIATTSTRQITTDTSTGLGNIAQLIIPGISIRILGVKIHFTGVPTANDFIVQSQEAAGPVYDTELYKANPGTLGVSNLSWLPDGDLILGPTENLLVTFTNAGSTQYGLTITYETI